MLKKVVYLSLVLINIALPLKAEPIAGEVSKREETGPHVTINPERNITDIFTIYLGQTDYGAWGVLVIVAMVLFREKEWMRDLLVGCFLLGSSVYEVAGLADFVLFRLYNGQRGKQAKYVFYLFYPVHLFLLAFICRAIFRS